MKRYRIHIVNETIVYRCVHSLLQRSCVADVSITYLPQLNATHCTSSSLPCSTAMHSRRRDGNTTTATYRNADAVGYERSLYLPHKVEAQYLQSTDIKHSAYIHLISNFSSTHFHIKRLYVHNILFDRYYSLKLWKRLDRLLLQEFSNSNESTLRTCDMWILRLDTAPLEHCLKMFKQPLFTL